MKHERISDDIRRIYQAIQDGRAVPGVPVSVTVAGGICLPEMRARQGVEDRRHAVRVREVRAAKLCHRRDNLSGHAQAAADVVHRHMVDHNAKNRCERYGIATCSRVEKLRDRLDMAPQNPHGDGEPKQDEAVRHGGSGRMLYRRRGA